MSLALMVISIGIVLGVGMKIGKNKENNQNFALEKMENYIEQPKKPESDKDALDMMEDMYYNHELEKFSLVELKGGVAKYQYFKNKILFTIIADEDEIECKVTNETETLFHYIFDGFFGEDDKKQIARSLIEGKDRERSLNMIERFIEEIVLNYDWLDIDEDLEIIDDIKKINEIKTDSFKKEESINEDELSDIIGKLKEFEIKEDLKEKFKRIIRQINKAKEQIHNLDIESKHVYDELIQKDLSNLFYTYVKLEDDKKKEYEERINLGLEKLESKTKTLLDQIGNNNSKEVDKVLNIINQRYYD